jgi:hypothetical protein
MTPSNYFEPSLIGCDHVPSLIILNSIMQKEYANLTFPLATCIVMSGIYEDDLDKADEIIYTGQGGNDLLGNHRQIGSQQLKRGNLALKVGFNSSYLLVILNACNILYSTFLWLCFCFKL